MPRAHRHFSPGHVWRITHRCHQRKFLLKFARDRRRYLHWLNCECHSSRCSQSADMPHLISGGFWDYVRRGSRGHQRAIP
jgi:hypothetical protein